MITLLALREALDGVRGSANVMVMLGHTINPHLHNVFSEEIRFTRFIESRHPYTGEYVAQEAPCDKADATCVYLTIVEED